MVVVLAAATASAEASYYVPRAHQACRASYRREVVRVRERRHGKLVRRHGRVVRVRQVRCVYVPPKVSAPAPVSPKVTYRANVDPTFVQSATNPLAVTYSYSADATQVTGSQTVDLAQTDQLPTGVLNFYSAQTPGGPESLYCSMNVGGGTDGGACPIAYQQTGTYLVTTEYIPSAAAAVTETDQETILPFGTTTTLTIAPATCPLPAPTGAVEEACYTAATAVMDQNGNPISGQVGLSFTGIGGEIPGGSQETLLPVPASCMLEVWDSGGGVGEEEFWVTSPDCNFEAGGVTGRDGASPATGWQIVASYPGAGGWSASSSTVQTFAP